MHFKQRYWMHQIAPKETFLQPLLFLLNLDFLSHGLPSILSHKIRRKNWQSPKKFLNHIGITESLLDTAVKNKRTRHLKKKTANTLPNGPFFSTKVYRQQPSPLEFSIDIWSACNSRLAKRETNHYVAPSASLLALAHTISCRPFCTASAIYLILSIMFF